MSKHVRRALDCYLDGLIAKGDLIDGGTVTVPAKEERFSKTASVKFMITMQDEKDLRNLGYSQAQIDKIKPQEAVDILKNK